MWPDKLDVIESYSVPEVKKWYRSNKLDGLIERGVRIVYLGSKFTVDQLASARKDCGAAQVSRQTSVLTIESTPPAADIQIDGAYVGSTPSTLRFAVGSYRLVVKKKGFKDWERQLKLSEGNIQISAQLEAE